MGKNYYRVLGVSRSATESEIKGAYRTLSLKHHPDKSKAPDAHEKFVKIGEAYGVLIDPEKRKAYDRKHGIRNGEGNRGGNSGPGSSGSTGGGSHGEGAAANTNGADIKKVFSSTTITGQHRDIILRYNFDDIVGQTRDIYIIDNFGRIRSRNRYVRIINNYALIDGDSEDIFVQNNYGTVAGRYRNLQVVKTHRPLNLPCTPARK